jgi:hypothetical protein
MMITTRVAFEAASAVYDRYIKECRVYGDDWTFLCELARQLAAFDYDWRPAALANIDE